jgi:hypothetical protein
MSTITIPTPDEIRKRLRGAVEEAKALRQLLRLAEAAERAERARLGLPPPSDRSSAEEDRHA